MGSEQGFSFRPSTMTNTSAATTTPSAAPPSMKLLIDTASQRIVFAEAGKDVVDFIFGLLAMPLGAVDRLLAGDGALGSIANVYASVEKMDAAHLQSAQARDLLLVDLPAPEQSSRSCTCAAAQDLVTSPTSPMFTLPSAPRHQPQFRNFTFSRRADDPNHALPMFLYRCATCLSSPYLQGGRGLVQGVSTYTVMDDLIVTPASSVSSVALLKKLGFKDLDKVEERTVNIGRNEALGILKAALHSKTVLTDALLANKKN
ncbi:hypothetical protein EJB05_31529, partial [Eragrostis curvula]